PILFEQQMQLWEWMASYYLSSEGEVMAAALPAHFKLNSETWLEFNLDYGDDFSALDHDEFLVAEALLLKKELKLSTVQQLLNQHRVYPVIRRLIDKRVCTVWEDLRKGYVPRLEAVVVLHPAMQPEEKLAEVLNQWSRAPKQLELLLAYLHLLKTEGTVFKKELLKKSGATESQLKGLVEKNILAIEKKQVDRIRYLPKEVQIDFQLSPAQQEAHDSLVAQLQEKPVCLFQGVTSSGKTMIYIQLIEECLQKGRQVLYLLPEIALTAQIIRRLQKHFGGHIGIYHSKFNPQERVEIWNKVRDGELKIILGARSALFLPFPDLGLIIADEEQDNSYKQQDPAPRYNARDVAIFYADLFKASVVLGSATPSVESYYHAKSGKYGWVQLNERYGGVLMPAIQIVDTRLLPRTDGNKIMISPTLQQAIEEAIRRERQVILFQNRRGYTPYQICKTCGWIPHCRNCDVSLTFHKRTHQLHCHYCGGTYPPVVDCSACGNHSFR
ncbi:MAG: primosomal protein N', partial [Chitinophagaceae bacterium]